MRELTDKYLRGIQAPESGRLEISDAKRAGLRLRVSSAGSKTWMFEKRVKGGVKRKHTLGTFPELPLAKAREIALELEMEARQGIDRVALNRIAKTESERQAELVKAQLVTVSDALATYQSLYLSKIKSGAERMRQLEAMLKDAMKISVLDLSVEPFRKMIEAKVTENKIAMANRLIAASSHFIGWLYARGNITTDFRARLPKKKTEAPRERVLTMDEIREIYQASFSLEPVSGSFFRTLILTGQRRGEIANLTKPDIDWQKRVIVKEGQTVKNKSTHITHLSSQVISDLKLACEQSDSNEVFTIGEGKFINSVKGLQARLASLVDIPHWTIHDFRTAFATAMAESGEDEAIIDRILNHSASGSAPSAVARVYNQSKHLPQRAKILDKWAQMVKSENAKVVRLG